MDLLDRIQPTARGLLDRVDAALLTSGAPAGNPIWPLLARVGALPGEAVDHLASVSPGPLVAAGDPVRIQARGYETQQATVPMPAAWRGPAAEGFASQWSTLSGHLAGDPESMAGRLADTARYAEEVAGWLDRSRQSLAGTLAECLGSAEAVTLRTATDQQSGSAYGEVARAAAAIGTRVLAGMAELLEDGQQLLDSWSGRLTEVSYRPPMAATGGPAPHFELG